MHNRRKINTKTKHKQYGTILLWKTQCGETNKHGLYSSFENGDYNKEIFLEYYNSRKLTLSLVHPFPKQLLQPREIVI